VDLPYKPKYATACARCRGNNGVVHVEFSIWLCRVCDRVIQALINELGVETVRRVMDMARWVGPHHMDPRRGLKVV
jgi:ribosomal protein L37AE/L43A